MGMIKKEMVLMNLSGNSAEEVLRRLSSLFVENGYAKESFIEAVVEREKVYPTGLPAEAFDVAIPHTVSEHVLAPAIAIGVLQQPVDFHQMGSPEIILHPKLVIMMAIQDPQEQLTLLRKMMKVLQNKELLDRIVNAAEEQTAADLLNSALA